MAPTMAPTMAPMGGPAAGATIAGGRPPLQLMAHQPAAQAQTVNARPAPPVPRGVNAPQPGGTMQQRPARSHPAQQYPAQQSSTRPGAAPVQPAVAGDAFAIPDGRLRLRPPGSGQRLPGAVQAGMESLFGASFGDVRVHVGSEAPSIGALAFTLGTDIYFAPGQYAPETAQGQRLLAHELTHVVQQRQGRVRNPFGSGLAVVQDRALEAEADRMALKLQARPHSVAAQPIAAQPAGARAAGAQAKTGNYQVVLGAYMHEGGNAASLPAELAGHAFVSIRAPGGRAETWGFSPANYDRYDPRRDLGRLTVGVPGTVHRDDRALSKPGVRTRTYSVSPEQAQAAMAKVTEYQTRGYDFSLSRRQCSSFALDVLRAARVDGFNGGGVRPPRELFRQI